MKKLDIKKENVNMEKYEKKMDERYMRALLFVMGFVAGGLVVLVALW